MKNYAIEILKNEFEILIRNQSTICQIPANIYKRKRQELEDAISKLEQTPAFSEVVSSFDTSEFIQDYERKILAINSLLDNCDDIEESYRLKGKREAYKQVVQDVRSRCQNV